MKAESRSRPAQLAWLIPGPGPDERLGSVLLRAAHVYGSAPETLIEELLGDAASASADVDEGRAHLVHAMARAIDTPSSSLWPHRLIDHPRLLAPQSRRAMCPQCWAEDAQAGRPRGFRRAWAAVLRTMCVQHKAPLELAPPHLQRLDAHQVKAAAAVVTQEGRLWLDAIEQFGRTLDDALFADGGWPPQWRGSPRRARSLLVMMSQNLCADDAFPPVSRVVDTPSLATVVRAPRHKISPLGRNPWDGVRDIADPMLRRAALWLVAWLTCPEWPEAWRPAWVTRDPRDLLPELPVADARSAQSIVREALG